MKNISVDGGMTGDRWVDKFHNDRFLEIENKVIKDVDKLVASIDSNEYDGEV